MIALFHVLIFCRGLWIAQILGCRSSDDPLMAPQTSFKPCHFQAELESKICHPVYMVIFLSSTSSCFFFGRDLGFYFILLDIWISVSFLGFINDSHFIPWCLLFWMVPLHEFSTDRYKTATPYIALFGRNFSSQKVLCRSDIRGRCWAGESKIQIWVFSWVCTPS